MADNVGYTPGEGVEIAADEIDGVLHQRAKMQFGEDGTAIDVSLGNPLPVTVSGASTEATLSALKASVDALSAKIAACNTGDVALDESTLAALANVTATIANPPPVGITDEQLRAAPVPVATTPDDTLSYLLNAILEKMPRVDAADRILTNGSEVAAAVSVSSGTVTTVGTVSNQTNIGGRDAAHVTFAMANMGALHIYNNILVTA